MDFQTLKIWLGIGLLFLILTNVAFFDVMRRDFGTTGKKALWSVMALIPFIGFFIYFLFGARQGKVRQSPDREG